jgi:hypothetical protein
MQAPINLFDTKAISRSLHTLLYVLKYFMQTNHYTNCQHYWYLFSADGHLEYWYGKLSLLGVTHTQASPQRNYSSFCVKDTEWTVHPTAAKNCK